MKYILFFIALFLIGCAEDEKSVSQSLFEACGFSTAKKVLIIEREIDIPISIHGYWYFERAIVELSQSDLAQIEKLLE